MSGCQGESDSSASTRSAGQPSSSHCTNSSARRRLSAMAVRQAFMREAMSSPKVLKSLDDPEVRYVLTIHNRPKAVVLGTDAFLELLNGQMASDRLLALQLGALVQGLEGTNGSTDGPEETDEAETEDLVGAF